MNIMEKRKKYLEIRKSFRKLGYVSKYICKKNKDK